MSTSETNPKKEKSEAATPETGCCGTTDPREFLNTMLSSMPPDVAANLRTEMGKTNFPLKGAGLKPLPSDFTEQAGMGFSPADMMAMFTANDKSAESMLPYLRKMYKHIGEMIKKYENSRDNIS